MRDRNGLIENPDKYLHGEIQGNVFIGSYQDVETLNENLNDPSTIKTLLRRPDLT